jgi:hypothetical protein
VVERLIRKITTAIAYAVFSAKVVLTLYDMMGAYTKAHDLAHKLAPAPYILRRSITDLNMPQWLSLGEKTTPLHCSRVLSPTCSAFRTCRRRAKSDHSRRRETYSILVSSTHRSKGLTAASVAKKFVNRRCSGARIGKAPGLRATLP